jgi:hypothetical protein
MASDAGWRVELERWLGPFLRRSGIRRAGDVPLYVAGLIGPGERKSVQPMAERLGLPSHDALHHFIAAGVWDAGPLEAALLREADRLVAGGDAFLIVDDTALPKKGSASSASRRSTPRRSARPRTARPSSRSPWRAARCRSPSRSGCSAGGVDAGRRSPGEGGRARGLAAPRTKPEMRARRDRPRHRGGVRFGPVLADADTGISAPSAPG